MSSSEEWAPQVEAYLDVEVNSTMNFSVDVIELLRGYAKARRGYGSKEFQDLDHQFVGKSDEGWLWMCLYSF